MKIRSAQLSDFKKIQELNSKLFNFEKKFSDTYNLNWPYESRGMKFFAERLVEPNNSIVFLAENESNQVVGYICGYVDTYSNRRVNPIAEIENMFIEEEFRRKGLGTQLINRFIEKAKVIGAKRIRVNAFFDNSEALEFYKSRGFKPLSLNLEQDL